MPETRERGEGEMSPDVDEAVQARSPGPFGGLDPGEAGRRSAQKRRERAAAREAEADAAKLTARQRFGIALSKLSQAQLDAVVQRLAADAAAGSTPAVAALARLADQAFGKASPEEAEQQGDDAARKLTRAERSALIASLMEEERQQRQPAGEGDDPRGEGVKEV